MNKPQEVFLLVNKKTRSILTGGGSSQKPSVHAYLTVGQAEAGLKKVGGVYYRHKDGRYEHLKGSDAYEIVRYKGA